MKAVTWHGRRDVRCEQVQVRMGQANVRRWTDDLLPFVLREDDPLGVDSFATHHLSRDDAPEAYEMFPTKRDGAIKVVFHP
jgi:threonine dehydrogenase-like Zn-dependent dehydrogenase